MLISRAKRCQKGVLNPESVYKCLRSAVTNDYCRRLHRLLRHGKEWIEAFRLTVACLEKAGATPRPQGYDCGSGIQDMTVLFQAVSSFSDIEMIQHLLSSGWGQELLVSCLRITPTIRAMCEENHELFELLLQYDGDVFDSQTLDFGNGPIVHNAYTWIASSKRSNLRIVERLRALGVPYVENESMSPFEMSVRNGQFQLANFFLNSCEANIEQLIFDEFCDDVTATAFGSHLPLTLLGGLILEHSIRALPAIKYLLHNQVRAPSFIVNPKKRWTALHAAVFIHEDQYDGEAISRLLSLLLEVSQGLKFLECKDEFMGGTPLHWAAMCGNDNAVKILLEKQANIWETERNGLNVVQLVETKLEALKKVEGEPGTTRKRNNETRRLDNVLALLEQAKAEEANKEH